MSDIHIHAPVVHIHIDQPAPTVVVNGDPDAVAEQIRQVLGERRRRGDTGEAGQPAVKSS